MALLVSVNFHQLGVMDSSQVHERVALARVQQAVMLTTETALSVLNTYICATQDLPAVQPERNPLRVEAYVQALHKLIGETKAPAALQLDWLQHMSEALGPELNHLYGVLFTQLAAQGVKAVGYAAVPSYAATGQPSGRSSAPVNSSPLRAAGRNPVTSSPGAPAEPVLTLDRLRRLLVGELEPVPIASAVDRFAAQFAREFESGGDFSENAAFQATMPAALEALQDMQQVDHLVERLGQRRHALLAGDAGQKTGSGPRATTREQQHRSASGLGQVLSLEVVSLMVDNIVHDVRMLDPIKDVIKNLEPALLQLALVDPRFFSDKQHPARRLLEEITQRSLAFENLASPGLAEFLQSLHSTLGALADNLMEGALAFAQALHQLLQAWDERNPQQQKIQLAVQALQQAEQRSLLAEKVAKEVRIKYVAVPVDAGVVAFLCGPWAQVVAHAQLADLSGAADPGQYRELMTPLIWSAQPELTRANVAKLTRLVPKLLAKLREGLRLIDYPSVRTSQFFELLMNLQQQAFKPPSALHPAPEAAGLHPDLLLADDPWVAPEEAKVSGFMMLLDEVAPVIDPPVALTAELNLPVGSWVEMRFKDVWVRTQLSWASPHGTLFLFTSSYGTTQSITKRSLDKLMANGGMRWVSEQPVVQEALDAVVKTAMLNSLDSKL